MLGGWTRVARNERGQDLAEYGIALGLVAAVAVAAALAIGMQVGQIWDASDAPIATANGNHGHHHGGGNSGNGGGNGGGNGAGN
jgi:Flp pilus assembly pilin Flp